MCNRASPVTLIIGSRTLDSIIAQAFHRAPAEACGALTGFRLGEARIIEDAVEAPNVAADPQISYQLDPRIVTRLLLDCPRRGKSVIGFYHSHTRGPAIPSATDCRLAWQEKSYLIIGLARGKPPDRRCWRMPAGRTFFIEDHLNVKSD